MIACRSTTLGAMPGGALRSAAFAGAVLTFAYIVGVALARDPLSWLARVV